MSNTLQSNASHGVEIQHHVRDCVTHHHACACSGQQCQDEEDCQSPMWCRGKAVCRLTADHGERSGPANAKGDSR